MNENTPEFVREQTAEWINDEDGDYEKNTYNEDGRFKFYLRFIKEHFTPCDECQKILNNTIYNAPALYLGNKSYEPPVELSRQWVTDEASWVEIEKRKPTEDDFKRIYGLGWEKYFEGWKEAFEK